MSAVTPPAVSLEPAAVSPELVLVDPSLATSARESLPARSGSATFNEPKSTRSRHGDRGPFGDETEAATEARRRLMHNAVVSEGLSALAPAAFRRRATLIPSTSAATSVSLFVLQLYLANGHLG